MEVNWPHLFAMRARQLLISERLPIMRKIPTLFQRDPQDMRRLLREVHPDCQWVIDGEGEATRKLDGTCVMFDGDRWWARREVKPGKPAPSGFVEEEFDPNTGKTVGWEPAGQSPFAAFLAEAVGDETCMTTYELCGPKINGNPEGFDKHYLIRHDDTELIPDAPRDFDGLAAFLADFPHEGIVWHHKDGRMAKIKRKDFNVKAKTGNVR